MDDDKKKNMFLLNKILDLLNLKYKQLYKLYIFN